MALSALGLVLLEPLTPHNAGSASQGDADWAYLAPGKQNKFNNFLQGGVSPPFSGLGINWK